MSAVLVRAYRPADRDAVRRIAYDTAMLGDTIADQYADFESMADVLTSFYTDVEPHNALVAEREGRVIGTMLSCLDTRRLPSRHLQALRHIVTRGVCFRPGSARFYYRSGRDTLVDLFARGQPDFDLARYPSHTHCNFAADGRGSGVGAEMYFRVFDLLRAQGSPGVHGEVMTENVLMLRWAVDKLGYELYGQPYPVVGFRGHQGQRLYLQIIRRDLTDWQPGAWQSQR